MYDDKVSEDAPNLKDLLIQNSSLGECCDCVSLHFIFIAKIIVFVTLSLSVE